MSVSQFGFFGRSGCTGVTAQIQAKPAAAPAMARTCLPGPKPQKLAINGNKRLPTLCPSARKP